MPYAGDDYRGRIDDARRQPGGSVAPTSSYEEYQRSRFR